MLVTHHPFGNAAGSGAPLHLLRHPGATAAGTPPGGGPLRTRTTNELRFVTLRLRGRNGAAAGSPQASEPPRADEGGGPDAGADQEPPKIAMDFGVVEKR